MASLIWRVAVRCPVVLATYRGGENVGMGEKKVKKKERRLALSVYNRGGDFASDRLRRPLIGKKKNKLSRPACGRPGLPWSIPPILRALMMVVATRLAGFHDGGRESRVMGCSWSDLRGESAGRWR